MATGNIMPRSPIMLFGIWPPPSVAPENERVCASAGIGKAIAAPQRTTYARCRARTEVLRISVTLLVRPPDAKIANAANVIEEKLLVMAKPASFVPSGIIRHSRLGKSADIANRPCGLHVRTRCQASPAIVSTILIAAILSGLSPDLEKLTSRVGRFGAR